MKKAGTVLVSLILCFAMSLCVSAEAIPAKPATEQDFYASDNASVLTEETKAAVLAANQSLRSDTGAEIVVVTVSSTDLEEPLSYAQDLGNIWGVGAKEYNNGAVLLVATEDKNACIALGNGLEAQTDAAEKILNENILPLLAEENYDAAVLTGFTMLVSLVRESGVGGPVSYYSFVDFRHSAAGGMSGLGVSGGAITFLVGFVVVAFVIILLLSLFGTRRRYGYGYSSGFPFMPWLFMGSLFRPRFFGFRRPFFHHRGPRPPRGGGGNFGGGFGGGGRFGGK